MTSTKPELPDYLGQHPHHPHPHQPSCQYRLCRPRHEDHGAAQTHHRRPEFDVHADDRATARFQPRKPARFQLPEESFILASGAADVLHNAVIAATLDEALANTTLACALTSRRREITAPLQTPRELVPELLQAAQRGEQVALVFGNETFGLSIEEVQTCNRLMTINGNPDYFSLNLAQAVQVVCYEIFSQTDMPMTHLQQEDHAATHEQIKGMVAHMENVMDDIGFFNRRNSERLMRRMQSLFGRANTQTEDIDILRGFFQ